MRHTPSDGHPRRCSSSGRRTFQLHEFAARLSNSAKLAPGTRDSMKWAGIRWHQIILCISTTCYIPMQYYPGTLCALDTATSTSMIQTISSRSIIYQARTLLPSTFCGVEQLPPLGSDLPSVGPVISICVAGARPRASAVAARTILQMKAIS